MVCAHVEGNISSVDWEREVFCGLACVECSAFHSGDIEGDATVWCATRIVDAVTKVYDIEADLEAAIAAGTVNVDFRVEFYTHVIVASIDNE